MKMVRKTCKQLKIPLLLFLQADPHQFWQCFYACILFIILLTGVKTRLIDSVWALADDEKEVSGTQIIWDRNFTSENAPVFMNKTF